MSDSKKRSNKSKGEGHTPIKRHRLTEDEKATVLKLYEEYGSDCWDKVQQVLHLKSKRTAREHFYKFLITDSKKPFTPEEDQLIIDKVKELGTKWSQIAKFFDNRSDINIRNRYRILARNIDSNKAQKRKPRKQSTTYTPEIKVPTQKNNISEPVLQSTAMQPAKLQNNIDITSPEDLANDYIILDFHHFDILTMKDINQVSPGDYFSPFCFHI